MVQRLWYSDSMQLFIVLSQLASAEGSLFPATDTKAGIQICVPNDEILVGILGSAVKYNYLVE